MQDSTLPLPGACYPVNTPHLWNPGQIRLVERKVVQNVDPLTGELLNRFTVTMKFEYTSPSSKE